MLGTLAHPRKPILLLLVFGVFLMIVGITALAQAVLVSTTYSQSILEAVVGGDAATVRALVNEKLTAKDLEPGATTSSLAASIQRPLHDLLSPGGITRIEIRRPDGTVIASDDLGAVGGLGGTSADFAKAIAGTPTATFAGPSTSEALGTALTTETLLREYLPLKNGERVLAVVGVWRDGQPVATRLGFRAPGRDRGHADGRARGGVRPVPRLPGRPGQDQPSDRPAARGYPARSVDRHAQPRQPRDGPRRGRRDGPDGQGADRDRVRPLPISSSTYTSS